MVNKRILLLTTVAMIGQAHAQSSPGFLGGEQPTASQWNTYFAAKQDYPGPIFSASGSAANINNAIIAAANAGGGTVFVPVSFNLETSIIMLSNVRLVCASKGVTLTLNAGVNADIVVSNPNPYSLYGTGNTGGIVKWSIEQCTLDGNYTNQTLPATCPDGTSINTQNCVNGIAVYGTDYTLRDVTIQNVLGHGIRRDGRVSGAINPNTMRYTHVLIDNVGRHGDWCQGPSDGSYSNVVVVDAGRETDNTYMGVEAGGNCTGDWSYFHGYHSSAATNRVHYQFEANTTNNGTITHVLSNFEGGRQELHVATGAILCSACMFYAPFSTTGNTALVDLDTSGNILQGKWIGTTGQSNYAVAFGPGGTNQNANIVIGVFNNFDKLSPFNFAHDAGTTIIGRGFAGGTGGATTFGGTVSANSKVDYQQTGGTAISYFQRPPMSTGSGGQPMCINTTTGVMYHGTAGAC
jgi:hypothetical protein